MANLSPIFNEAQLDDQGNLLTGGLIYTYSANSSTALATYTTQAGTTAQSNPITLNARGEVDNPIWLADGSSYKMRLFDSSGNFIREFDNVTGVNDTGTVTTDQWIASGVTPTYVSATQFTVPGDQTSAFQINRRVKATVTAGTIYGYISNSVYGALTTVTCVWDSGSLDTGLSSVQLGLITPLQTSLPLNDFITPAMLKTDSVTAIKLDESTYGAGDIKNLSFTVNMASNAVTIALTSQAGTAPSTTDPVEITFRNSTVTSSAWNKRAATAATSTVISSGSTGGTANNILSTIAVLAIDNAGTIELAWCNANGGLYLDESSLISTTAEGGAGAADSGNVIYSTTARSNVPFRILGYFQSTQATAGTWASAASLIQVGGQYYPKLSLGAQITTTATISQTISGIPSWAKRVSINFIGLGTNGTSPLIAQLNGDATSYLGSCTLAGTGATSSNYTTGHGLTDAMSSTQVLHGRLVFETLGNNQWTGVSNLARSDGAGVHIGASSHTTSAALSSIVITTTGGVNTLDAGAIINVLVE